MGFNEWFLAAIVFLIFALIVLRPGFLWGRGNRRGDSGTSVGVDGSARRDRDDDNDGDSDGGDGGGGGD